MNKVSPTQTHQPRVLERHGQEARPPGQSGDQSHQSDGSMNPEQARSWVMYEFADGSCNVASLILIPKLIILMAEGSGVASSWSAWFFANFMAVFLKMICYFTFIPICDFADLKYRMFRIFVIIGTIFLLAMALVAKNELVILAVIFYVLAKSSQGMAGVLHMSFLNPIAKNDTENRHILSNRSIRYFAASMAIYIICLAIFFLAPMKFLHTDAHEWLNLRGPIVFTAFWWGSISFLFTFPKLGTHSGPDLPPEARASALQMLQFSIHEGYLRRIRCLKLLTKFPDFRNYMIACILFKDCASIVNSSAAIFAVDMGLSQAQLAVIIVVMFLCAIIGTYLFTYLSNNTSIKPKIAIMVNLVFMVICVIWLLFAKTFVHMLIFAVVGGFNFGPMSAFIRSLFAQMIPLGLDSEFFSLFEGLSMLYSWVSPLIIALIVYTKGNHSFRYATVGLIIFEFAVGIPIFMLAQPDRGHARATELRSEGLRSDVILSSPKLPVQSP